MAGNANSGRKPPKVDLDLRLKVIQKSWELIAANLDNTELDLKFRLELASKIGVKSMPTELSGGITASIVAMGTIKYGEAEAKFNIGTPVEAPDDSTPEDTQPTE
jgi:hypothetical protein